MLDIGSIWEFRKIKHTRQLTKEKSYTLFIPHVVIRKGIAAWRALSEDWSVARIPPIQDVSTESYLAQLQLDLREVPTEWNKLRVSNWELCGTKTHADIRTKKHMKTTRTLPRGTSGNGTNTTGSLPWMLKARIHPWHREKITPKLTRATKDLRPKDEQECNYPILQSNQTRQRPFEERHGNGVLGPHHLRFHLHGQGRKLSGPLVKSKVFI